MEIFLSGSHGEADFSVMCSCLGHPCSWISLQYADWITRMVLDEIVLLVWVCSLDLEEIGISSHFTQEK